MEKTVKEGDNASPPLKIDKSDAPYLNFHEDWEDSSYMMIEDRGTYQTRCFDPNLLVKDEEGLKDIPLASSGKKKRQWSNEDEGQTYNPC
jgi:hypothetical protein